MALQRTPGIKLPPDLAFPRFPRWRGVYLVASGNGALHNFGDWRKPVGCVATAGGNPNPETPSLSFISLIPGIFLFVDFSGPGLSGPGFHLVFFPILVISRYTAGKHTRRMGILLTQTVRHNNWGAGLRRWCRLPFVSFLVILFLAISTNFVFYMQNFVSDRLTIPLGSGRLLLPHFTTSSGRLWDIVPKASHLSKRLQVPVLRGRYSPFLRVLDVSGFRYFSLLFIDLFPFLCRGLFSACYS